MHLSPYACSVPRRLILLNISGYETKNYYSFQECATSQIAHRSVLT
jgi:hypothetical protein